MLWNGKNLIDILYHFSCAYASFMSMVLLYSIHCVSMSYCLSIFTMRKYKNKNVLIQYFIKNGCIAHWTNYVVLL